MSVYYINEATTPVYYDVWSTDGRFLYSTWNLPFVYGDTSDEEETDSEFFSSAERYADGSSSDNPTRATDWTPYAPVYDKWSTDRQYSTSSRRSPFPYGNTSNQQEEYNECPELNSYDEDRSNHLSKWQVKNLIDSFQRINIEPSEQEVEYSCAECGYVYNEQDESYMEFMGPDLTGCTDFVPKLRAYSDQTSCRTVEPEEADSCSDRNVHSEHCFSSDESSTTDSLSETNPRLQATDGGALLLPAPVTEDVWKNHSLQTSTSMKRSQHYDRLRHEINQDGDQLLSHLSTINLLQNLALKD